MDVCATDAAVVGRSFFYKINILFYVWHFFTCLSH